MFRIFRKQTDRTPEIFGECGILVFESTPEVIQAEMVLKKEGFKVRVMGPPPEIQTGCDMVLQIEIDNSLAVERLLRFNGIEPLQYIPIDKNSLLKPVDLFHSKDYGKYLMVRCANMKMTVDRETKVIVNVSGGGCPDVPYLAKLMVGQKLTNAPQPIHNGATLCGYALQMAYEELLRQFQIELN
ncbi:DUF3343 domain-containing protein [bacterium]|nr:DUF3343 domain-containing protein [bacterium]MBU1025364.1 DUF3343 domain-containing protein [bacterium]